MSKTKKDVFSSNVQPRRQVREKRQSWRCIDCGKSNDAHLLQCRYCGAFDA